ncbi:MAG: hypothetical protein O6837_07455, partial [Deltaproteobacteria bacterium]|nr:hypothetical protein [Deltaproteobacteria bacterium]
MKKSTERILTTHAGSLPRPDDLWTMLIAKDNGQPYDQEVFARRLRSAVAEVVKKQIDSGIDIVNDGEFGKTNFSRYIFERLSGFVARPPKPEDRLSMIF